MKLEDWFRQKAQAINAFYPVYDDGNATVVLLEGEQKEIIPKRIKTVKRIFCRSFGIDPSARTAQFRAVVGRKNAVPLVIKPGLVLVPFKMRKPLGADDGAWGYVVENKIKYVSDKGEKTEILFKDGSFLEVMVHLDTVKQMLLLARLVHNLFCEETGFNGEKCPYYRGF